MNTQSFFYNKEKKEFIKFCKTKKRKHYETRRTKNAKKSTLGIQNAIF